MKTIVCYGDTNTWGYDEDTGDRLPWEARWTGVLARELGPGYRVIEEGLCGRTVVNEDPVEEHKNGRTQLYPCLESHRPIDLLVLMLGQVELKSRFSLTAHDIAMGMEMLVRIALSSGCGPGGGPPAVLLMSPVLVGELRGTAMAECFPLEGTRERSALLPELYRRIARRNGIGFLAASELAKTARDGVHIARDSQAGLGRGVAAEIKAMCR